MKSVKAQWDTVLGGFGGLLLISLIGIGILVFGGIYPTNRQIAEVRVKIGEAREDLRFQKQAQPLLAAIERRELEFAGFEHQRTTVQAFPASRLGALGQEFSATLLAGLFAQSTVEVELPDNDREDVARLRVQTVGSFEDLPQLFEQLEGWPHWDALEAFLVRARGSQREIHFTLRIPLE